MLKELIQMCIQAPWTMFCVACFVIICLEKISGIVSGLISIIITIIENKK